MANQSLQEKRKAFQLLDDLDLDNSNEEDNAQQAALSLNYTSSPVLSSPSPHKDNTIPRSPKRRRCSPTAQCLSSASSHPKLYADNSNVEARPSRQPERLPRPGSKPQEQSKAIIIDDEDNHVASRKVNRSPTREVPNEYMDTPGPLMGQHHKRKFSPELAPEYQRILKDCYIYFVPNNDVDMARRERITRALEHGAKWVKHWHQYVTHVVVDKDVPDELAFLGLGKEFKGDKYVVVNQQFTVDCIRLGRLTDPTQLQYQLEPPLKKRKLGSEKSKTTKSAPLQRETPERDHETGLELTTASQFERGKQSFLHARDKIEADNFDTASKTSRADENRKDKHVSDDELTKAIFEAKSIAQLPIESDADESTSGTLPRDDVPRWQRSFSCMQPSSSSSSASGPNSHTIDLLQQLEQYYTSIRDQWRSRAYQIAISKLKKEPNEIFTAEQAKRIGGIGNRIADKIEEINKTSRLRRLENALLEPTDQALKVFLGVYGVGWHQAQKWVHQGFRSLEDLKENHIELTKNQKVGLEHYEDFQTRIPRDEVTQLGAIVTEALHEIDQGFESIIGGSYRRGATSSGDIDIIITHPTSPLTYINTIVLETLIPQLFHQGFLTACLAVTSRDAGTKWHGACQLPSPTSEAPKPQHREENPWRRIDLLLVPREELGAATLYFTGNDIFNWSMRLLARKKGMRLNQRGLYKDVARTRSGEKMNEGNKTAGRDERAIFEALGVPWRECTERNC